MSLKAQLDLYHSIQRTEDVLVVAVGACPINCQRCGVFWDILWVSDPGAADGRPLASSVRSLLPGDSLAFLGRATASAALKGLAMSITLGLVVLIVGLFAWSWYRRRTYFKKLGLPGPPPLPIVGNMLSYGKGMHVAHEEWSQKYGKTYGVFEGARKAIITSDLDIMQEVLIKQYNNFCNRQEYPLRPKLFQNDLLSLKNERWKLMRSMIASTFSKTKMQKMTGLIVNRSELLMKNVNKLCSQGGNLELSKILGSFAIESGALCAYATEIDSQNLDDSTFIDMAELFFRGFKEQQTTWAITLMMPWTEPIFRWLGFSLHPMKSVNFFKSIVVDIIHERRADPNQKDYVDFLQLLMNAHKYQDEDTPEDEKVYIDYKRRLTEDEVTAMAVVFFLGNYETTTTTLCFTLYLLATHPEVQERLIQEIDDVIGERSALTYGDMAKLPYLEMVIHESMRVYPPAIEFDRICQEDCVIKGVQIPKGTMVEFPVWVIHHDPEVWPDPYTFDPERFSAENRDKIHPLAWVPFGGGPRKCIGYRFATLETTLVMVRLLQKYRFETCEKTEIPPKVGKHGLILPENGITLRLVPRNK